MREINFTDLTCEPGHIMVHFCENWGSGIPYENTFHLKFEPFIPSSDTIALILGSFCGTAYDKVYMELEISRKTFEYLKTEIKNLGVKKIHGREDNDEPIMIKGNRQRRLLLFVHLSC